MSKRSNSKLKVGGMLADVVPVKAVPTAPKAKPFEPTPEQKGKADYVRHNSLTYRRKPRFEELALTHKWITKDGVEAMKRYRDWFECSDKSLTRCSLDVEGRGGGLPSGLPPIIGASFSLELCRAAIGTIVDVFDKVVLEDKTFSEVAIERFGSRRASWLKQPTARQAKAGKPARFVEKIVPKSGTHREIIAHEFQAGLKRLVDMVAQLTSTTRRMIAVPVLAPDQAVANDEDVSRVAIQADNNTMLAFAMDAEFFDERGFMLPYADIAAIIRQRGTAA